MPGEVLVNQQETSSELVFCTAGTLELHKDATLVRVVRAESEAPNVVCEVRSPPRFPPRCPPAAAVLTLASAQRARRTGARTARLRTGALPALARRCARPLTEFYKVFS